MAISAAELEQLRRAQRYYDTSFVPAIAHGGHLPPGGVRGQVLVKRSSVDYDAMWVDFDDLPLLPGYVDGGGPGGGGSGGVFDGGGPGGGGSGDNLDGGGP